MFIIAKPRNPTHPPAENNIKIQKLLMPILRSSKAALSPDLGVPAGPGGRSLSVRAHAWDQSQLSAPPV